METATQALHRLTSYAPGRAWDQPAGDPRVRQDLETSEPPRAGLFGVHLRSHGPDLIAG